MFIHEKAIVEQGARVGEGTRVWAFTHILPNAAIGRDCNICDHVFIENDVVIGDRVTVKCGIYLWKGVEIQDLVFLGPNVVFTNDRAPRSQRHVAVARTLVRQGASIGANATILPGITIGAWAMIGAGSVVLRDVPDFGLVVGNPARLLGYVCLCSERLPRLTDGEGTTCTCGRSYKLCGNHLVPCKEIEVDW